MRSSAVIAASAALVAGANAWGNATIEYTTEVLTAYTTFCPAATSVVHNSQTYTVTEATTLTITNCPCTVTHPVVTSPVVYCPTCAPTSPAAPVIPATTPVPVSPVSETSPVAPVVPETTPVPVSPISETSSVAPVVPATTPAPVVPVAPVSGSPVPPPVSIPVYGNSTVSVPTGTAPVGSASAPAGSPTSSKLPVFTGAANKMAASGASLAGLLGLAAYLL